MGEVETCFNDAKLTETCNIPLVKAINTVAVDLCNPPVYDGMFSFHTDDHIIWKTKLRKSNFQVLLASVNVLIAK